jgi:sulfur carrier protein ThiS
MKVEVEHSDQVHIVESDGPISVSDVLSRLSIPPSTVLAVFRDTIIPHTSIINDDTKLELVIVSSGG